MIALGDANLLGLCAGFFGEAALREDGVVASGLGELDFRQGRYFLVQSGLADERHNGRFNVGFADGHIGSLRTKTLFSNRPDARSLWNNDNEPHPELLGFGESLEQ